MDLSQMGCLFFIIVITLRVAKSRIYFWGIIKLIVMIRSQRIVKLAGIGLLMKQERDAFFNFVKMGGHLKQLVMISE